MKIFGCEANSFLDRLIEQRLCFVGALFSSLSLQMKRLTASLQKSQSQGTVAPQRANALSLNTLQLPLESKKFTFGPLFYILEH